MLFRVVSNAIKPCMDKSCLENVCLQKRKLSNLFAELSFQSFIPKSHCLTITHDIPEKSQYKN